MISDSGSGRISRGKLRKLVAATVATVLLCRTFFSQVYLLQYAEVLQIHYQEAPSIVTGESAQNNISNRNTNSSLALSPSANRVDADADIHKKSEEKGDSQEEEKEDTRLPSDEDGKGDSIANTTHLSSDVNDYVTTSSTNTTNITPMMQEYSEKEPYPTPIVVVGFPKAGTSTIKDFFRNAGYITSHYKCVNRTQQCGTCMKNAVKENLPLLKTCGDDEAFTEINYVGKWNAEKCVFPQIEFLEEIHQEAPNATFVLNVRDLPRWAVSVTKWYHMPERLALCRAGPNGTSVENLIQWHQDHIDRVHRFVEKYPSHKLIVVDIQSPNAGEILADKFHTNSSNWGHSNQHLKNVK